MATITFQLAEAELPGYLGYKYYQYLETQFIEYQKINEIQHADTLTFIQKGKNFFDKWRNGEIELKHYIENYAKNQSDKEELKSLIEKIEQSSSQDETRVCEDAISDILTRIEIPIVNRITGTMRDKDGNPLNEIMVHVHEFKMNYRRSGFLGKSSTGSDGRFELLFEISGFSSASQESGTKNSAVPILFLLIPDGENKFLSVHEIRDGAKIMFWKQMTTGHASWIGKKFEASSDLYEFEITIENK